MNEKNTIPKKENESSFINAFKNRLYDAYGVCSYLAACNDEGLQDVLNGELLRFALQTLPKESPLLEEMASCMLFTNGISAREVLDHLRLEIRANPKQQPDPAAVCLPEFEWAQKRMRLQNPAMRFSPLTVLYDLYSMIYDHAGSENAKAQEALGRLKAAAGSFDQDAKNPKGVKESLSRNIKKEKEEENEEKTKDQEEDEEGVRPKKSVSLEEALSRKGRQKTQEKVDEILAELDDMTGLEEVKKQVHELADYLQLQKIRQDLGLKNPALSRHMIFYGNPGTGKTTVARLLARIYRELGLLKTGQLVETDRSGLVAGYIGQTAQKTQEVIKKALGGILFIDEAYALVRESPNDFGKEAVETLLKAMEDHRDDLVVIAAGYPKQMDDFLAGNPGLASRFGTRIHFQNYTSNELRAIAKKMAEDMDYEIEEDALDLLEQTADHLAKTTGDDFGNARTVRNLLEKAMMKQAGRLMREESIDPADIRILKKEDFQNV